METKLIINPEFANLIPPLTEDEQKQLEDNILADGIVLTPIIVWNGTIIDGHNRYKIIEKHPEIPYQTLEKQFESREDAMNWICDNQLGRRNLTPEQKKFLIGQRYDTNKAPHGGDRRSEEAKSKCQGDILIPEESIKAMVARECGVSESYVARAAQFARGVDAAEEALPGIKREILSGSLNVTNAEIVAIAKAPVEKRRELAENLRKPKEERVDNQIEAKCARDDNDNPPVSPDHFLDTFKAAVETAIATCDRIIYDCPTLVSDEAYHGQVNDILKALTAYAEKIRETKIETMTPKSSENDTNI